MDGLAGDDTLQKQLAKMMALAPGDVRCIYIEGAGCYGRNAPGSAADRRSSPRSWAVRPCPMVAR